ncbi:MAG: hypothetical protein WBV85_00775 [Solirubrobacteraceae bacterium]
MRKAGKATVWDGEEEGQAMNVKLTTARKHRVCFAAALVFASVLLSGSASAVAAEQSLPGWEVTAKTLPTYLQPSGRGEILIKVVNVGPVASKGAVTVTDTLPPGITATSAGASGVVDTEIGANEIEPGIFPGLWDCSGNRPGGVVAGATVVTCTNDPVGLPSLAGGGGIPTNSPLLDPEHADPEISIAVRAPAGSGMTSEPNQVSIVGGGALSTASTRETVTVSATPAQFGLADADAWFSNANGTIDTQAGSHPYEATFAFDMNNVIENDSQPKTVVAGANERNLEFNVPPGFIGNPYAVPMCPRELFNRNGNHCPSASQVGVIEVEAPGESILRLSETVGIPVYNIVPPEGVPAEFGFQIAQVNTLLTAAIRSGSDYAISTHGNNISQNKVLGSVLTLWGEPGDPSHDAWRVGGPVNVAATPFLTLPTSCEGPQAFSLHLNAWQDPDLEASTSFPTHDSNDEPVGFTGCDVLNFGPVFSTSPDTSNADTPAGLTVEVKPPAGGLLSQEGLGTSDIKEAKVTLPPGLVINPGQAAGLRACGPAEDALTTAAEAAAGKENAGAPSCPLASTVGTDEITVPILKNNLQGNVFVLQSNPPNLQLLIAASGEGVNVKIVADVHLNEQTGQVETTVVSPNPGYPHVPQAPVSDFKLSFSGGAQAALDTPTTCGSYVSTSSFVPWASPFVAEVSPTASLAIDKGTNGAPCPSGVLPFSPSLIAGSTTDQAGGFTDFSLLLQAPDDQQRIERLQFKVPSGLLGMISNVPLCEEPQAAQGTCSGASQIGHTTVASGPGPYPLVVPQPGQPPAAIYLTGPYKGAPFGLSIVVPVVVGPFTLQTQVVRAKIEVDPLTSQITVTTDPLPQIIDGVPTDLRTVDAVIDRPRFMFNPTNCAPMSFSGTAWGTPPPGVAGPGSTAAISSHFQMGSCQALKFKPNFKVSTSGKTSRKNGASLDVKLTYPTGGLGANQASSQSNISQVKVDLPKQLPSRLSTLQKACPSATFETNPAGCSTESRVGSVTAITPVLPVALTGPAYFVSYGGAKFPELVFVLQGDNVTVYVHAETFISTASVTSSTLRRVPDVPISSFELKLPQGPYSALAAIGNLCKTKLKMPTAFTAQDGATIHQNTPINVTGCPKAKKKNKKANGKHKTTKKRK